MERDILWIVFYLFVSQVLAVDEGLHSQRAIFMHQLYRFTLKCRYHAGVVDRIMAFIIIMLLAILLLWTQLLLSFYQR